MANERLQPGAPAVPRAAALHLHPLLCSLCGRHCFHTLERTLEVSAEEERHRAVHDVQSGGGLLRVAQHLWGPRGQLPTWVEHWHGSQCRLSETAGHGATWWRRLRCWGHQRHHQLQPSDYTAVLKPQAGCMNDVRQQHGGGGGGRRSPVVINWHHELLHLQEY